MAAQKGFAPILIVILIVAAIGIVGAFYLGRSTTKQTVTQQPSIPSSSTSKPVQSPRASISATPDPTATWQSLSLGKLNFKIPSGWAYEDHISQSGEIIINPSPRPPNSDAIAAFSVEQKKLTTLEQTKKNLISDWQITDMKDQSMSIAGQQNAIIIKAQIQPGMIGDKLDFALVPYLSDVYILTDNQQNNSHELYFDQILSTFKFLP